MKELYSKKKFLKIIILKEYLEDFLIHRFHFVFHLEFLINNPFLALSLKFLKFIRFNVLCIFLKLLNFLQNIIAGGKYLDTTLFLNHVIKLFFYKAALISIGYHL